MKFLQMVLISIIFILYGTLNGDSLEKKEKRKIAYITIDHSIPFWEIMSRGIKNITEIKNYELLIYDAKNSSKRELELLVQALKDKVDGIIISPSNSSAAVTILEISKNSNTPVVISDIGTDGGEYVSYISSNNKAGAYSIGKLLGKKMIDKGWQNGKVGIIAIPQKRINGQERTAGFMKALQEEGIKGADIKQMVTWSEEETYRFTKEFIHNFPDLRAIWLQTSNLYKGALKAIKELDKSKELFLVSFDAEPEFIDLIKEEKILVSGMQQPYIMGKEAARCLINHLNGKKVKKNKQISILTVTNDNINENLITIEHNVLGIE